MSRFFMIIAIVSAFAAAISAQRAEPYFGMQTHYGQWHVRADKDSASVIRELDSLVALGAQIIRDECYWEYVETTKGVYTFPPQNDFFVEEASKRGIEVMMLLDYNNPLYASGTNAEVVDSANRHAYADYCVAMVEHFAPMGIKYFEMWNEPNLDIFWQPTPGADEYVEMIKVAYPAIKAADSSVVVLGCSTSPLEGDPPPQIQWDTYITSVFDLGGGDYMDAVSFHVYRFENGPEDYITHFVNTAASIAGTEIPFYITETGLPTHTGWPWIDEEEQAEFLTRVYLVGDWYDQLKYIIYYDFRNDGTDASYNEMNFGIINHDFTPKRAYGAVKTLTSFVGDKVLADHGVINGTYINRYSNGADTVTAVWRKEYVRSVEVAHGAPFVKIVSMDGETVGFHANADGKVPATVFDQPRYIVPLTELPALDSAEFIPDTDTIVVGQAVPMQLKGYAQNGVETSIDPRAASWSFSGSEATVDADGLLTGAAVGGGTLTATFDGVDYTRHIEVIDRFETLVLEPFDDDSRFEFVVANLDSTSFHAFVDTNATEGSTAMLYHYEYDYISLNAHRVELIGDYTLFGDPDTVAFDFLSNGGTHAFRIGITDATGDEYLTSVVRIDTNAGWKTITGTISSLGSAFHYPASVTKILFYVITDDAASGETCVGDVMFDNLRAYGLPAPVGVRESARVETPTDFALRQNYPNPFNPVTTIRFSTPERAATTLKIFDALGREVATLADGTFDAGEHRRTFDARDLAGGVYFYRLTVGERSAVKKMLLLK
jgi:hypothetical protein